MAQPTPRPAQRPDAIAVGATVYGADDARFGQVAGQYRNYLIVERGFFMPVDYYVPMAAVRRVDGDLVTLAIPRDAALSQGWERPPFTSETAERGLRRPAVGRPGPSAAGAPVPAPDASRAGAVPDVNGATAAGPVRGESGRLAVPAHRAAAGAVPPTVPGGTQSSPAAAFGDTYAVGTNTESYHAMAGFSAPADATAPAAPVSAAGSASPRSATNAVQPAGDGGPSGSGPAVESGDGDVDRADGGHTPATGSHRC